MKNIYVYQGAWTEVIVCRSGWTMSTSIISIGLANIMNFFMNVDLKDHSRYIE